MKAKTKTKKDFSCGGVVWDPDEQKLLLIYVKNLSGQKIWTFPKGHPETDESDEMAALREVLEETGWQCEVVEPLTDVHYYYTQDKTRFSKTVRWYLMNPVQNISSFDPNEILDCKWADLGETKQLVTYGSDFEILKKLEKIV